MYEDMFKNLAVCCGHDIDYYFLTGNEYFVNRNGNCVLREEFVDKLYYRKLPQICVLNVVRRGTDILVNNASGINIYNENAFPDYNPNLNSYRYLVVSQRYAVACLRYHFPIWYLEKLLTPKVLFRDVREPGNPKPVNKRIGACGFIKFWNPPPLNQQY